MTTPGATGHQSATLRARAERLDSWKEIASYLKRDIRTVQRWEKLEALPVHRHQHQKRGSAFAYTAELEAWWEGRGQELDRAERLEEQLSQPAVHLRRPFPPLWSHLGWLVAGLTCVLVAVLAVLGIDRRGQIPGRSIGRLSMVAPPDSRLAYPAGPAVSPDARKVVFVAYDRSGVTHLWVRPLDSLDAQLIPGTEGAAWPFWSADSRAIAFFANGKLKRADVEGGSPRIVSDAPNGRGGTWIGDRIVFAPYISDALYEVQSAGGTPRAVTTVDRSRQETAHRWPQFLPDGRHLLFFVVGGENVRGVYLTSVGSSARTLVLRSDSNAVYAGGYLLFWREGGLAAQQFDLAAGRVTGDIFRLPERLNYNRTYGVGFFSASNGDMLAYQRGTIEANQLAWFDRAGHELALAGPPMTGVSWVALAPNAQQIAVQRWDSEAQNWAIWRGDLVRGGWSRFTFSQPGEWWPVWSPDGRRIAFASTRDSGLQAIYHKRIDTGDREEPLVQWPTVLTPTDWSADGRYIAFQSVERGQNRRISILPLAGSQDVLTFGESPFDQVSAHFSPDGHWVAYASNESGAFEVYVQSFPGRGRKHQVSTSGGFQPRWRRDGKELYYLGPDRRLMSVAVGPGETLQLGSPQPLFELPVSNPAFGFAQRSYDVTSDGQRFIVSRLVPQPPESITVVINWTAGLER